MSQYSITCRLVDMLGEGSFNSTSTTPWEHLLNTDVVRSNNNIAHGLQHAWTHLQNNLANYVAPTRVNVAKSWPTLRVVATQKSPRHTQFISITANMYKSAQTYGYLSYNTFFVFELKGVSRHATTCRQKPTLSYWTPCRHDIFLCLRHDQ